MAASEVVQLYVSFPASADSQDNPQPIRTLRGFEKVKNVQPGETRKVVWAEVDNGLGESSDANVGRRGESLSSSLRCHFLSSKSIAKTNLEIALELGKRDLGRVVDLFVERLLARENGSEELIPDAGLLAVVAGGLPAPGVVEVVVLDGEFHTELPHGPTDEVEGGRASESADARVAGEFDKHDVRPAEDPVVVAHANDGLDGEVGKQRDEDNVEPFLLHIGVEREDGCVGVLGCVVSAVELPKRIGLVHDAVGTSRTRTPGKRARRARRHGQHRPGDSRPLEGDGAQHVEKVAAKEGDEGSPVENVGDGVEVASGPLHVEVLKSDSGKDSHGDPNVVGEVVPDGHGVVLGVVHRSRILWDWVDAEEVDHPVVETPGRLVLGLVPCGLERALRGTDGLRLEGSHLLLAHNRWLGCCGCGCDRHGCG
ncbi:hypothetical protein L1887_47623 [Cichorium endivia]|nr:hypothetical protein L1887_47623 [Cichorium endivia]